MQNSRWRMFDDFWNTRETCGNDLDIGADDFNEAAELMLNRIIGMGDKCMSKILCDTCGKFTDYTLHSRVIGHEIGGKEIVSHEKYAACNECGSEVTVAGLYAENEKEFESVCNGLKGCGLI